MCLACVRNSEKASALKQSEQQGEWLEEGSERWQGEGHKKDLDFYIDEGEATRDL